MRTVHFIQILALVLIFSAPALGAELVVAPDGSGDYPTIQAAVDAANNGDTVLLLPGTYTGEGNRDVEFDFLLTVASADPANPAVIDCEATAIAPHRAFVIYAGEAYLQDLVMRHGNSPLGGAVRIYNGEVRLTSCLIEYNVATQRGGAVYVEGNGRVTFDQVTFGGNAAGLQGGAIHVEAANSILLDHCTLFRNLAPQGSGLYFTNAAPCEVAGSIFAFGRGGSAIEDYYGGGCTITCSDLFANEGGDWVNSVSGQLGSNGNLQVNPEFCDPLARPADYRLAGVSPLAEGNTCGAMGAQPVDATGAVPVYGLSADGTGMFPTIQAAIDAAPAQVGVALEDGTYTGPGNRDLVFLGKKVQLTSRSGDREAVIIDAEGSLSEPHRVAWLHSLEPAGTTISHLTMKGGFTESSQAMPLPGQGGALLVTGGAQLTLDTVIMDGNSADDGGSAVKVRGPVSFLTITNSRFYNHPDNFSYTIEAVDGGLIMDGCQIDASNRTGVSIGGLVPEATLTDCAIEPVNSSDWQSVTVWQAGDSPIRVENCTFGRPDGAFVMTVSEAQNVIFTGCTFTCNPTFTVPRHLVDVMDSQVEFHGCTFENLKEGDDAVLAVSPMNSQTSFQQCTFTGFAPYFQNVAMRAYQGSLEVTDCQFIDCKGGVGQVGPDCVSTSISGCTFDGMPGMGLELEAADGPVTITDCVFNACSNALTITDSPDCTIDSCTFSANPGTAPALLTGSGVTILGSLFTGNFTASPGGCISATETDLTLDSCTFTNNSASFGGAVALDGGQALVTGCDFSLNSCGNKGGAWYDNAAQVQIQDCRFQSSGADQGGALFSQNGTISLTDVEFSGNIAIYGGAASGFYSAMTFSSCQILNNRADQHGGLYLVSCESSSITDCLLAGNLADARGSALDLSGSSPTISGCTIVDNGGPGTWGQVVCEFACSPDITATIIADAREGAAMYTSHPDLTTVTATCLDVVGNPGGDWTGPLAGLEGSGGNFSTDPQFCDPAAGDYQLASSSPCLAAGNGCSQNIGALGQGCGPASPAPEATELPRSFAVLGNHPNPFNPRTEISFALPSTGPVTVDIHDVTGRRVRQLITGEQFEAGSHQVVWDGCDDRGKAQSSGIYLYRITAEGRTLSGKMAMIR